MSGVIPASGGVISASAFGIPVANDGVFVPFPGISWTASTTNPTLGNGTLVAEYTLVGKLCTMNVFVKYGSTTNRGSGGYNFSVPFTAVDIDAAGSTGSFFVNDSGVALRDGAVIFDGTNSGGGTKVSLVGGASGQIGSTNFGSGGAPVGSTIKFTIPYHIL